MSKKLNIVMYVLVAALLICGTVVSVLAILGDNENKTTISVVGTVDILVDSNIVLDDIVLEPNKTYGNMVTTISLEGEGVDTYLKVKLETDYKVNGKNVIEPVLFNEQVHTDAGKSSWMYNDVDGCYYYLGYVATDKAVTFNTGVKVTNELTNADALKGIEVTLTVYAIQRGYQAYLSDPNWADASDAWKQEIAAYDII